MAIAPATTLTRTTWQLDPSHLELGFAVRHLMISTVKGRFGAATGTVTTDGDDFATAEVEVAIDAASLDTRESARDTHLRSADFFDVERFPAITFKSRTVTPQTGRGRYTVVGDLTIRGVSREISLDVTTEGFVRDPWGNEKAGFSAVGHLNRTDYGLTWNAALETGGVLVGEEVKLHLDVELTKKNS
jgi:polyisoprenoid-binding protein YceI